MPCIRHVQKVFERMAFTKNDEAVSPVIGVILMVAITVILAAVIAAFVFGMAGNVQSTKNVAITAQRTAAGVQITNMGGSDAANIDTLSVSIEGAAGVVASGSLTESVGSYAVYTAATVPSRVLVTGTFNDGSTQVLLDTTI